MFQPEHLEPHLASATTSDLNAMLEEDCQPAVDREGVSGHRLTDRVRERTLRRLVEEKRLEQTVLAQQVPGDRIHDFLRGAVLGRSPRVEELALDDLYTMLQCLRWFGPYVPGLPPQEVVLARVDHESILQPLRHLTGHTFVGRERELADLADFVGVLPPESGGRAVRRTFRKAFSRGPAPILFLYGPGGIGKTTLLARFLLDHVEFDSELSFVYFNFDRPDLVPEQPLTLLIEAAKQISSAHVEHRDSFSGFRARWEETLARPKSARGIRSTSEEERALREFVDLVDRVEGTRRRLLLVGDTFEEVQRRGDAAVRRCVEFLRHLSFDLPDTRVVLAGRAVLDLGGIRAHELEELDRATAIRYLSAVMGSHFHEEVAEWVVSHVGRNPLSLRLAADVVSREGTFALRDVKTKAFLVFKIQDAEVQGRLYRRILEHLPDPDLQRLAHPGLALRRITPDIITQVLARPCGLDVPDDSAAQRLFDLLARELSLVSLTEAGAALYHRPDVRRAMLPLLRADFPKQVERIHRRAIDYYSKLDGLISRGEELYHRLALGQTWSTLDRHWTDEAAPFLQGAADELPPESQAYLASRMDLEVNPRILDAVGVENWRRQVERRGRALLDEGYPSDALEQITSRRGADGASLLPALEARALVDLGKHSDAIKLVERTVERSSGDLSREELFDLTMRKIEALTRSGGLEEALDAAGDAVRLVDPTDDTILKLRAHVTRLRILRLSGEVDSALVRESRTEAIRLAKSVARKAWKAHADLLRDLAAEVGAGEKSILVQALEVVGIMVTADLASALAAATRAATSREVGSPPGEQGPEEAQSLGVLLDQTASGAEMGTELANLLTAGPLPIEAAEVTEQIGAAFREESDAEHHV
jgi:tetratricopeptide (TPR) repeat protein